MATFTWTLQGTSPTTIGATDIIQFAGATFDSAIEVSAWNDSTHVKSSGGSNLSSGNTPRNNKFISQTGGTGGDSQIQINGGSTVDLDTLTTANAAIKINFADDASVITEAGVVYAFDGTTPATAPVGVSVKMAEVGDTNWNPSTRSKTYYQSQGQRDRSSANLQCYLSSYRNYPTHYYGTR